MLRCDQRPASEALGWVRLTDRQTEFPMFPPSVPVRTIVSSWKLFTSRLTLSPAAVLTSHSTLFTLPVLLPEETVGKDGEGKVDINLGQLSAQFLPLSELFVSAAESFIVMGSWCSNRVRLGYCLTELRMWGDGAGEHYSESLVLLFLWYLYFILFSFCRLNWIIFTGWKFHPYLKGMDIKFGVFGGNEKLSELLLCEMWRGLTHHSWYSELIQVIWWEDRASRQRQLRGLNVVCRSVILEATLYKGWCCPCCICNNSAGPARLGLHIDPVRLSSWSFWGCCCNLLGKWKQEVRNGSRRGQGSSNQIDPE